MYKEVPFHSGLQAIFKCGNKRTEPEFLLQTKK